MTLPPFEPKPCSFLQLMTRRWLSSLTLCALESIAAKKTIEVRNSSIIEAILIAQALFICIAFHDGAITVFSIAGLRGVPAE